MEDKTFIKGNISYPSQVDSFTAKSLPEWGLSMAKAIESEWFFSVGIGGVSCKFYTGRAEFMQRRIYAKGLVPMSKYLPMLGTNGDVSLLNLSKKPLSIIPKLVDVLVNGMVDRNYSIRANAIDPVSQEDKIGYRKNIEEDMNALPIIQKAKEDFGIDIGNIPTDKLPETKDELNIHMQMEYKPSKCLSEQMAITTVMEENMYRQTIDKQVKTDLVVCGIGWVKNRFNPGKGIILEYVDAADKVHSYTKDPYFRDCFYHGEFKTTLISDVLVEYPWLTDPKNTAIKDQLVASGDNWNQYHGIPNNERIKGTTNLLYFTYKTTRERAKKIKQKATGEKIVSEAQEGFDENEIKDKGNSIDFKRTSIVEEVLMEGVYVLGTEILLKWEVAKNMSRPKSNKRKVIEQYIGMAPNYQDGYIDSPVARMMPIEDKLNVIELKSEQIIQGITPDGIAIDLDAIAALDLGDGKVLTAQAQYDMFLQKGSFLYRSYGEDGGYNGAQVPFKEIKTGDSLNKLIALGNKGQYYFNLLTDVIGLNKASDASTPDKDSLVGIQKIAALNSNVATRHILNGGSYITLETAKAVGYRFADILKYFPDLRDDLIQKIGATAVEDLDSLKDLHLSDFAIFLDLEPDDEEKAKLEADLSMAVEKGYITVSDKYKVLDVKILDLAIQYMGVLIEKGRKQTMADKEHDYKIKSDNDIRAAQEAEKARQETAILMADIEAEKQKAIKDGEIEKEKERGKQDRLTEELKGKNKIELQYVINTGAVQKIDQMESNKDERSVKEATRKSRMDVEKKKENPEPIDFESEEQEMKVFDITE